MDQYVRYSEFGAVGDGVNNDFFAMQAAHEYANKMNLPVKADPAAIYRISNTEADDVASSIIVKTDTDFCGATVIFDDTDIAWCEGCGKSHDTYIFKLESRYAPCKLDESCIEKINVDGGVHRDITKKIDTGLGFPAMLVLKNDDKKVYIRYGGNQNAGVAESELILVDSHGNVDESAPLLFDYDKVTEITAYRIDEPPMRFENAHFITKASRVNLVDKFQMLFRGILITRPNVIVKNIKHSVENEIFKGQMLDGVPFIGHSYWGFIIAEFTHNLLIEDCVFQARAYYIQGTYDLIATMTSALTVRRCIQSNFFPNHGYPLWGVAGTNYCKNMVYEDCRINRYDAHQGVVNGRISNCEISSIRLIGGGDMLIENTKIYNNSKASSIQLREDFGCTFRGTITLKNCELADRKGKGENPEAILVAQMSNWDFGYTTYFPNIVIDNLKIPDGRDEIDLLYDIEMKTDQYGFFYRTVRDGALAISGAISADGKPNVNPYVPPRFIKVINNEQNGYKIKLPDVPFFKDCELSGITLSK